MSKINRREFVKRSSSTIAASLASGNLFDNGRVWGGDAVLSRAKSEIEKVRMRNVKVRLVGERGHAISNTAVKIRQVRHGFIFGDQLSMLDTMYRHRRHETDQARQWNRKYLNAFNAASVTFHWPEQSIHRVVGTQEGVAEPKLSNNQYCIDWSLASGLAVMGRSLFWPTPQATPDSIKMCGYETRRKLLEARVRNLVSSYRGKMSIWDVATEPTLAGEFCGGFENNQCSDSVEQTSRYIAQLLQWSREEDASAQMIISDYGLDTDTLNTSFEAEFELTRKRQNFLKLLRNLKAFGNPPDAIGLQPQTGRKLNALSQVRLYDEISTAGLPIHVMGFWGVPDHSQRFEEIPQSDRDHMMADYISTHLTCAFAHPNVDSFFFWGFMRQAVRWCGSDECEPTVVYEAVTDLINNRWMTRTELTTDSDGYINLVGFIGEYSITWTTGMNREHKATFSIGKSNPVTQTITC